MPVPRDPSVSVFSPEITVTLGDQSFTIQSHPASRWLAILLDPDADGTHILPGLLAPEEQELVDDLLFEGKLPVNELRDAIRDVVTVASGHRWWWTFNLLSVLRGQHGTRILGRMAVYDPERMPLAAWVNALYSILIPDDAKEQDIVQFDTQLEMPPADVELELTDADIDANTSAFFGMMRQ